MSRRQLQWIASLLLWASVFCQAADAVDELTMLPPYEVEQYEIEVSQLLANERTANLPAADKIAYYSAYFLGKPYILGALGEGPGAQFDQGPVFRTDGFDCLTLVSTVLALANAEDLADFKLKIAQVRYKNGRIAYVNRNHFTSTDWNINNQGNGYIHDVTTDIVDRAGQPVAQTARAMIDKKAWYERKKTSNIKLIEKNTEQANILTRELRGLANQVDNVESELPYIPLSVLFDANGNPDEFIFQQIPTPSIIEIVRPNWQLKELIGTNLNVSHLGFALRTKEGLIFREASSIENQVIDIELSKYLQNYLNSPTIKGINIQKIQ